MNEMITAALYQERRLALMEQMDEKSVVLLFSGKTIMRSADEEYPFSVDRSFYYLCGIDRADMVLLMHNLQGEVKSELFIPPYDAELAKWVGPRMKEEEAMEISGVDAVYPIEQLKEHLHDKIVYHRDGCPLTFGLDLWKYRVDQDDTPAHAFAAYVRHQYPDCWISDIYDRLVALRIVKSKAEIACMRKAQQTTKQAIEELMAYAKPGVNERALEGAFDFALAKQGVKEHAFPSIVAGGARATTLHYSDNDQIVKDGELVLLDLGSTHQHYCADISRTFPVNGKFTPRQKELYELVLEIQEKIIHTAKAGMELRDLQNMVIRHYEENLHRLGLDRNGKQVTDYYWHGVSHHLGLDTHDISLRNEQVLEPGMVITVEPGIYVEEEGIGIRIEDDILITETGAIDLSEGILKSVEEIESFMAKAKKEA
ncbi:aminopeptidase P N-terminal domain-containing protein [Massilicoli timonensis]|uniref:aminopeptidase P N-terminal domain-containing protein n=1 Tax=Massilicoli timonensis TaxID=2015901 RepID=UPI00248CE56E|nr:aminopeptidase P N-terminal domain-containing protein [Massilicoli timonensis]